MRMSDAAVLAHVCTVCARELATARFLRQGAPGAAMIINESRTQT
jgi:hypothetical protein